MKKRPIALFVLSVLLAGLTAYAALSVTAVGENYQYLFAPPQRVTPPMPDDASQADAGGDAAAAEPINSGLTDLIAAADALKEELYAVAPQSCLTAILDGQTLTNDNEDAPLAEVTRVEAITDGFFGLRDVTLTSGRLLYPEEMQRGAKVILLSEPLAVKLFLYPNPIDRRVTLGGAQYRVVGVFAHGKEVGDRRDTLCYLPLTSLTQSALPITAMCYEAAPQSPAGSYAAFESAAQTAFSGGECISLHKLRGNALLPLRVMAFLFGGYATLLILRLLNRRARTHLRAYRDRLKHQYALRLMPWLTGRVLLLAAGYALCAALLAALFVLLLDPVFTFPEWVPAILVEPKDIATAFWNCWQLPSDVLRYNTPQSYRISFFQLLLSWSAAGLSICCVAWLLRLKNAVFSLLARWEAAHPEGDRDGDDGDGEKDVGASRPKPPVRG